MTVWNKLRRVLAQHMYTVVATALISGIAGVLVFGKKWLAVPGQVALLQAQQDTLQKQMVVFSKGQQGMLSVMCLDMSDAAFDAAIEICGESFRITRILSGERARRAVLPPKYPF